MNHIRIVIQRTGISSCSAFAVLRPSSVCAVIIRVTGGSALMARCRVLVNVLRGVNTMRRTHPYEMGFYMQMTLHVYSRRLPRLEVMGKTRTTGHRTARDMVSVHTRRSVARITDGCGTDAR